MPQLRMMDGVEISNEEKVKAENLHSLDFQDREIIFKSLLPEEKFVDRRINSIEDVAPESESDANFDAGGQNGNTTDRKLNSNDGIKQSIHQSLNTGGEYDSAGTS